MFAMIKGQRPKKMEIMAIFRLVRIESRRWNHGRGSGYICSRFALLLQIILELFQNCPGSPPPSRTHTHFLNNINISVKITVGIFNSAAQIPVINLARMPLWATPGSPWRGRLLKERRRVVSRGRQVNGKRGGYFQRI